ncbi:putative Embryo sac development arrest 6 [Quillaja saponaria]|uniref:Embryo sac development arrest 6 n=1 Tax=Quillaja saponaria TaxID=32244 RepID=A0AAD7Q0K2_QUISA|nr:putative Embryo sac development arrest 6 [Quillaja saponaria]
MNTKTMRLPPRRVLTATTPSSNPTNKRKERENGFDGAKPSTPSTAKVIKPGTPKLGSEPSSSKRIESASSNQLLAGYLAHEFLTKGNLLGQTWDPDRGEPARNVSTKDWRRNGKQSEKWKAEPKRKVVEPEPELEENEKNQKYAEVASLLKTNGAHLPGIFNPTQLGRFLQL